jgi:hypothetical protein
MPELAMSESGTNASSNQIRLDRKIMLKGAAIILSFFLASAAILHPAALRSYLGRVTDSTGGWQGARWGMTIDELKNRRPHVGKTYNIYDGYIYQEYIEIDGVLVRVEFDFGDRLQTMPLSSIRSIPNG